MSRAVHADLSVFSVGGASQLGFAESVTVSGLRQLVEGRSVDQRASRMDAVKRNVTLDFGLFSNVGTLAAASRVSNLDISALTVGTVSYLSTLRGGSVTITNNFTEGSGAADAWMVPIYTTQEASATLDLAVPVSAYPAISGAFYGTMLGANLALSFTLNGNTITIPMTMSELRHTFQQGELQILSGTFAQRGAVTAAPATTTLLGSAITTPGALLGCVLTSRATNGVTYTGDFVVSSVSFGLNDSELVNTRFNMTSSGAVTAV